LHVIRADVDLFGPHETSEFMTTMRNEGEKYLNKVKRNANEKNIQTKTEIISSTNIAGGIVDYAEENNIDLIVIGIRSGFKKLLLGSVAITDSMTLYYVHIVALQYFYILDNRCVLTDVREHFQYRHILILLTLQWHDAFPASQLESCQTPSSCNLDGIVKTELEYQVPAHHKQICTVL
jgi:hypothetical protein